LTHARRLLVDIQNRIITTYALSPTLKFLTSGPTAETTPAISDPRTAGYIETWKPLAGIFQSTYEAVILNETLKLKLSESLIGFNAALRI